MGTAYGSTPIGPRHKGQSACHIPHGARHGADVHEPQQGLGPVTCERHPTVGGLQPDYPAEGRRLPYRARQVAADTQRRKPRRDRRRLASTRSAGCTSGHPGVLGPAEDHVVGLEPEDELRHVGVTQEYPTGLLQPGRGGGVVDRYLVSNSIDPLVVLTPSASSESLAVKGTPWSGPNGPPRITASSAFRASSIAPSASVTTALSLG